MTNDLNVRVNAIVDAAPRKRLGLAYALWFIAGPLGGHQVYLGKYGRAVLYLLTAGLFGIAWLVDLFTLPGQTREVNDHLLIDATRSAGLLDEVVGSR